MFSRIRMRSRWSLLAPMLLLLDRRPGSGLGIEPKLCDHFIGPTINDGHLVEQLIVWIRRDVCCHVLEQIALVDFQTVLGVKDTAPIQSDDLSSFLCRRGFGQLGIDREMMFSGNRGLVSDATPDLV